MNVLVIPEDFRHDQYVLKPIVKAMMTAVGKPRAIVRVCNDPLLGSVNEALKWERIEDIIERYQWTTDLFLLCVDRDGKEGRRYQLNNLEEQAALILSPGKQFLAENAWQEVEVWLLAGHDLPKEWSWRKIREEVSAKEIYFEPFARQRGVQGDIGEGRKILGEEAARRYSRIRQRCRKDVANLQNRISEWTTSE